MSILFWAIPFFMISMLVEWRLTTRHTVIGYDLKDSAANLAMGIGNLLIMTAAKGTTLLLFMAVYEYRLFDLPVHAWWVWLLLIPTEDFFFYWYHRISHDVRFFWAAHVNHHSSQTFNLSTALRQSWTTPFVSWIFWLPLPLLGFHPVMVVIAQAVSLLYQYWVHTELIERLGPLEWVMNTPSHHRVHHATNPDYLDRNHAGIFIVWDRLFGTFQDEHEQAAYGLTTQINTYNPIKIAFHEWWAILMDVRSAQTWRGRLLYVFGPPGWREDGSGLTSADIRQRKSAAKPAHRVIHEPPIALR